MTRGPAAAALWAVAARTHGAICLAHDPFRGDQPGVDLNFAAGHVRTAQADTLVDRVELWLASEEHSQNLLTSLANEPEAEDHAVLVFDHQTEPEYWSATEGGTAFCPTREIQLPDEIDVLWLIIGPIACRYSATDGWRTVRMPGAVP